MFEGTVKLLNTESVNPSNISSQPFKTWNLPMPNSYCDHRNFYSVNQALLYIFKACMIFLMYTFNI